MTEQTVVGVFEDHGAAVKAMQALREAGFENEQLGFAVRHDDQGEENVFTRGIIGGLVGAADAVLVPITGPADASTILGSVLPVTEQALDRVRHPHDNHTASTTPSVPEPAGPSVEEDRSVATDTHSNRSAVAGGITGGVVGGVLGAAASLLIPGIGPAIAGGILIATLGGAAIGSVAGSFLNMGIPEHKARDYEDAIKAGHVLLTVQSEQTEQVESILRRFGAQEVDIHVS